MDRWKELIVHVEHAEDASPVRLVDFPNVVLEPSDGQSLLHFFVVDHEVQFSELLLSILLFKFVIFVFPMIGSVLTLALVTHDVYFYIFHSEVQFLL